MEFRLACHNLHRDLQDIDRQSLNTHLAFQDLRREIDLTRLEFRLACQDIKREFGKKGPLDSLITNHQELTF